MSKYLCLSWVTLKDFVQILNKYYELFRIFLELEFGQESCIGLLRRECWTRASLTNYCYISWLLTVLTVHTESFSQWHSWNQVLTSSQGSCGYGNPFLSAVAWFSYWLCFHLKLKATIFQEPFEGGLLFSGLSEVKLHRAGIYLSWRRCGQALYSQTLWESTGLSPQIHTVFLQGAKRSSRPCSFFLYPFKDTFCCLI